MWSLLRGFVRKQRNNNPGHDAVFPMHPIAVEQPKSCARREHDIDQFPATDELPKPTTWNSSHYHNLCGLDDILSDIGIYNETTPPQSSIDWTTFRAEHEQYVSSFVDDCPFHLFDTKRERNVTHSELREDIFAGLNGWIRMPLTCSEVVDAICEVSSFDAEYLCEDDIEFRQNIEAYVFSAMARNPFGDCEACFLTSLQKELWQHNYECDTLYVNKVLYGVHQLITDKQKSITVQHVREQIELLGQYAILSHRWESPGEELCFDDAANLSDPFVKAKQGFKKMKDFRGVVKSLYGCRYLWLDSVCISEPDRNASIPRMFGWYHRAYVCVIYLLIGQVQPKGFQWTNRGWTLQEYLAARRIKIIGAGLPTKKFDAIRRETLDAIRGSKDSTSLGPLGTLEPYWNDYRPGTDKALSIFGAMRNRKTTRPEDKAYCLFSALQIDIPVNYGEGFDMAFYRLQVECLTRTGDLRLLLWEGASSPHNSALAGDFAAFKHAYWYEKRRTYAGSPAVSFDSEGVLRMLVSLHPWHISPSKTYMFALLGEVRYGYRRKCFGILLRRRADQIYRRIQSIECEESDISVYKEPEWVYIK